MNMKDVNRKLADCSAKIGMWEGESMSLDQLIEAYLSVREANIRFMAEIETMRERGYDQGYVDGLEQALKGDYINTDDLRNMTMAQVAALLYDGE
jgi:hypothetical protein